MFQISNFVTLFFLLFAQHFLSTKAADKPDFIIELFRHGARGPNAFEDDSWPENQRGVLTAVGMRQHYILGNVLAQKYPQIFGLDYDYDKIYALSDVTPRCVQSTVTQLFGIYLGAGPSLKSNYPKDLAIPPYNDSRVLQIAKSLPNAEAIPYKNIPEIVQIVDETNSIIFKGNSQASCPNMLKWTVENMNDSKAKEALEIFKPTMNNLNKYLKATEQVKTLEDLGDYGDTLNVDIYDNRTVPGGFSDEKLIGNVSYAASWAAYHLLAGQPIQAQLGAYNLVDEFLKQLENFRKGENFKKAALYGGHDYNIALVLVAFGVVNEDCLMRNFNNYAENPSEVIATCSFPTFASNIIIELYNSTASPYVRFLYNNIEIPVCNGKYGCPYEEFIKKAKEVTGNNDFSSYQQKCGVKKSDLSKAVGVASVTKGEVGFFNFQVASEEIVFAFLTLICGVLSLQILSDKKKYSQVLMKLENNKVLDQERNS